LFFFFSSRRRHTIYWRDWSSDVCSSDLQYRLGSRMPRPDIMLRLVEVTGSKVSPVDLAMGLRRAK